MFSIVDNWDEPQYFPSIVVPLTQATNDILRLAQAARATLWNASTGPAIATPGLG